MSWTGSIVLDEIRTLDGIIFQQLPINPAASLRFLSVVDVARIPLCLVVGPSHAAIADDIDAQRWLNDVLLNSGSAQDGLDHQPWWATAQPDSTLGVLIEVGDREQAPDTAGPRVTQLLLYASRDNAPGMRPPTPPPSSQSQDHIGSHAVSTNPTWSLRVLSLSSDLLEQIPNAEPTPPPSPLRDGEQPTGYFLSGPCPDGDEPIHQAPIRKRKSAAEAFDEASERRKQARRRGGQGVSAAAASKTDSQAPTLQHRRSTSNTQPLPLQTRPLSISPSVASSRPTTSATGALPESKRSTLSHVQSVPISTELESKNKDLISRTVMAGIRLYGYSQSKSRKSRSNSSAPAPSSASAADASLDLAHEQQEMDRQKDEEYKLLYHQVYKSTSFAFRSSVTTRPLQPFSTAIRDTVDKLLSLFTTDPISQGFGHVDEKLTPGGRKAFGSAVGKSAEVETGNSPAAAFGTSILEGDARTVDQRKRDRPDRVT